MSFLSCLRALFGAYPLRTMAIWLALVVIVFLTRGRWDAWVVEKVIAHVPHCTDIFATPDGTRAASAANGRYLAIWDTETGKRLALRGCGSWNDVSSDRRHVIQRNITTVWRFPSPGPGKPKKTRRCLLELIELESGKCRFRLEAGGSRAYDARFTSDGGKIVAWHEDNALRLWDVSTGEAVILSGEAAGEIGASRPPIGHWLTPMTTDGTWKATEGGAGERAVKLEGAVRPDGFDYIYARLLPDGRRIAG